MKAYRMCSRTWLLLGVGLFSLCGSLLVVLGFSLELQPAIAYVEDGGAIGDIWGDVAGLAFMVLISLGAAYLLTRVPCGVRVFDSGRIDVVSLIGKRQIHVSDVRTISILHEGGRPRLMTITHARGIVNFAPADQADELAADLTSRNPSISVNGERPGSRSPGSES